jgi:quinol monooxygenase YgiN
VLLDIVRLETLYRVVGPGSYVLVNDSLEVAMIVPDKGPAKQGAALFALAKALVDAHTLDYHVHRDRADSYLFVFYETWSSLEALRNHLVKLYIAAFLAERYQP